MSRNVLRAAQNQHNTSTDSQSSHNILRWFLSVFLAIWSLTATVIPVVVLYRTGNPLYLSGFTLLALPVRMLSPIIWSVSIGSERYYELEKIKAQQAVKWVL